MVSKSEIVKQLKKINFDHKGWGRSEVSELPHIILPGENIYECVNGMYEGGFALLVATDIRLLLIDKKPLNYLTVEDLRFDTINEMDYNHRLFGAEIGIASGSKTLRFRSYNQKRLRKLIGHVQYCMAEGKQKQNSHQDTQVSHLEQINLQLQSYLSAQNQYQQQLQEMNDKAAAEKEAPPEPPKPSNELADYLYAQSLLSQYESNLSKEKKAPLQEIQATQDRANLQNAIHVEAEVQQQAIQEEPIRARSAESFSQADQAKEIYEEGVKEIFGKLQEPNNGQSSADASIPAKTQSFTQAQFDNNQPQSNPTPTNVDKRFEVTPMQVAYSKLPMALRSRKFSKPSIPQVTVTQTKSDTSAPQA
jgi:hypothetical protein